MYQTALTSLVEPAKLEGINNINNLKATFRKTLNEEFSGTNMARLTKSRPDFIIIDFFADIHFGVTRKIGRYITRNHMAFKTLSDADIFYKDSESTPPERMRFNDSTYRNLAIDSLYNFQHRLRDELPEVKFIVNSAHFSLAYTGNSGEIAQFEKTDRMQWKNTNWSALDELATNILDAQQIRHSETSLLGSSRHPRGLHPVHYIQEYYDDLWHNIHKITSG